MKLIILWVCSWIVFSEGSIFLNKKSHGINVLREISFKFHNKSYVAGFGDAKNATFTQKLDHFNPTDESVWSQRYWQHATWYVKNSPVFLMIGGESPENELALTYSSWASHIKKYKAMAFLLEHRFYGYSKPFENLSAGNLTHLNSEQALADLAYFIEAMNKKHNFPAETKWVVFGGSYSATLAVWIRIKYPHLVYAAYATGAPLVAKVDFPEYFQVVTHTLASYKKECVSAITEANSKLDKMARTKKGRKEIQKMFNLCYELKGKNNISTFFSYFAVQFAGAVQYNHPIYRPQVKHLCDIMTNTSETLMKRYGRVIGSDTDRCIPISYEYMIEDFRQSNNEGKAWFYQTCTEFGWYQTSSKHTDPFSRHLSLPSYTEECKNVYGKKFNLKLLNDGIERTNIFFGGLNVKVGRILFIHGSADPWHPLGIFESGSNKLYEVIYIKNSSHCADYYMESPNDIPEMVKARKEIDRVMTSWLS